MEPTTATTPQQKPRRASGRKDPLITRFLHHLKYTQGKHWEDATPHDHFMAVALAVREKLLERLMNTQRTYYSQDARRVYYLSLEYLIGRKLRDFLLCIKAYESVRAGLADLGLDLASLLEVERDAGLGNGGLGRLAACYLESAATLQLPVHGYGLRYDFGIFEQTIEDGWQIERPDDWLRFGSPWEIARPEYSSVVRLYGRVEMRANAAGESKPHWVDCHTAVGLPYDVPVPGYQTQTTNLLRLWSARAPNSFDLDAFNRGGYVEAVRDSALTETITKVLYPADQFPAGKELRLTQQYFFVACTLSDIIRRYEKTHDDLTRLPEHAAIQLNDTHPALCIAEMMRILVDERAVPWDKAWDITNRLFAYTNHTLLPEALEHWSTALLGRLLPRHLQIIYDINARHLEAVTERWPGDMDKVRDLSLVREDPEKAIRMAHLAIAGSHTVNGVAPLHSRLLRERVFPAFDQLYPGKFTNVTNGVTPRRWVLGANPALARLITSRIGDGWLRDASQLRKLEPLADDVAFREAFRQVKRENKERFAAMLKNRHGLPVSPDAMFDVQVKRLHEYKRQLLNVLRLIARYFEILDNPLDNRPPRVALFGAKAAPAYTRAKLIIKLICDVARTINMDKRVGGKLKVCFLPNYCVSLAEQIIPAADLSEQISTAGLEASGTGNMKFAMNGALTIGTLDGANIDIREAVGEENFFLFGLTADEVDTRRPQHNPWHNYHADARIRRVLDALRTGEFNAGRPQLYEPVFNWLTHERDYYMVLADAAAYLDAHEAADKLWQTPDRWTRATILNVARIGEFSSDRSVRDYAQRIWKVKPVAVRAATVRNPRPRATSKSAAKKASAPKAAAVKNR